MSQELFQNTSPEQSLTLYDLQRMVRASLESRFSSPVWISAEISELKVNRSGHCYLNLVEKGGSDGAPRAEARAVIWRSAYMPMASMFSAATGSPLAPGLRVLIRVLVTYHEVYGFSLQIVDIDPNYTLGEVERRRRETIARLEADGVWDMNHELPLPRPMLRIAVVSSATAAGYRDFMEEIRRTPYRFQITLFESLMQGESAEQSVVNALAAIASREESFDVVAIIRGGGSTSDLSLFDSYYIASCVAQFPLPVITGIGHDKDVSVSDMVAHTMCKTPTAVATFLAESVDAELNLLQSISNEIFSSISGVLHNETLRMFQYLTELQRMATESVNTQMFKLDSAAMLLRGTLEQIIASEQQHLNEASHLVESYSVDNILRLGFAVLRGEEGVITSVQGLDVGDTIDIALSDGAVEAEIRSITSKTK